MYNSEAKVTHLVVLWLSPSQDPWHRWSSGTASEFRDDKEISRPLSGSRPLSSYTPRPLSALTGAKGSFGGQDSRGFLQRQGG